MSSPPCYVDGAGTMEVIVHGDYYEGGWITVFRCTPAKVVEMLEVGCDA